jgi:uncharacterized protein YbjT (DUF2867 family)
MPRPTRKPDKPVAITGATGRLGGRIARRLAAAGSTQRFHWATGERIRGAGLPFTFLRDNL